MNKIKFENLPSKKTPLSAEVLNAMQDNIEEAITDIENMVVQIGKFKIGKFLLQYGLISNVTVPATSYTTITVSFEEAFESTPEVFVQPKGNYNIISQISGSETTKTLINVRSNDGTQRTGRSYSWFAIGLAV